MLERQKRLNEVYEHLHNHFGVHTKGDFAEAVQYARAYISSAMNGNEKYLTDKLFTNICDAYPGMFNLDYLLTGNGDLLTIEEDAKSSEIEKAASPTVVEQAANIIDLYAGLIKEIESLRSDLKAEIEAARKERQEAKELTTMLHDCLFYARDVTSSNSGISMPRAADDGDY